MWSNLGDGLLRPPPFEPISLLLIQRIPKLCPFLPTFDQRHLRLSVQLQADAVNGHKKSFMLDSTLPLVDPRTVTSSDSSRPPFHIVPRQLPGYTKSRLRSSGLGMVVIFGSGTSADIYFTHSVCNICYKATSVKILESHCITFASPLNYSFKVQSMTVCPPSITSPALKEELGQKTGLSLIDCLHADVKHCLVNERVLAQKFEALLK